MLGIGKVISLGSNFYNLANMKMGVVPPFSKCLRSNPVEKRFYPVVTVTMHAGPAGEFSILVIAPSRSARLSGLKTVSSRFKTI